MADKPDLLEAAADMLCEAAIGYGARGMTEKADKCCKVADELRARVGGWQPIATAPKDGTPILTASHGSRFVCYWDTVFEQWCVNAWRHDIGIAGCELTHWMPLPAAPAEGGG